MILNNKQISLVLVCLLIGMAASVWVVNLNFIIDSDVSNSATVWHEITQHGWSVMKKWRPTPDNWYFSVYPIHFLFFELTGSTSPEILRWLATAQLFVCAVLAALICFERSKSCLSFILVPLLCGLGHYALNTGYVAHPFSHNITNLYGLFCVYLYIINLQHRSVIIDTFIYLLIIIASISDPWLLAAFYLPLLFATCYEIFRFRTRSLGALVIPLLSGVLLFSHTIEHILNIPVASFELGSAQQMVSNAKWFLYDLGGLLNIFITESEWSFTLSSIVILIAYLFSIRKPLCMSSVDFLILLSVVGIASAFILSNTPGAAYSGRFFVNIFYLAVSVIFLRAINDRKIMFIPLIMILISNVTSNLLYQPASKRPSTSAELITFMRDNNLHYGFGPYWGTQALATSWRSNWQQVIRPAYFDKKTGYMNLTGRAQTFDNWYDVNSDMPWQREFVAIVNDGEECQNINLCLTGVKKQFGEPDQTLNFKNIIFYVYNSRLITKLATANLDETGTLEFGVGNKAYAWSDWSHNENGFRWTDGNKPSMLFYPKTSWRTAHFVIHAFNIQSLKGILLANKVEVQKIDLKPGNHNLDFILNNNTPNDSTVMLEFYFDMVKSPNELGINGDTRKLGLQVSKIDYSFER